MREIPEKERLQQHLAAFQLNEVFPERLQEHLALYRFEPGEAICAQGEQAEYVFVLVKGKIKVHTTTSEGKTLIISFKTPLEVIGDIEYIRGGENLNTVSAVTPVEMIGVRHRWLRAYGQEAPLLQFLLEIITRKFYSKSVSMSFNLLHPVEVRLASYLLSVSYEPGEEEGPYPGGLTVESLKDTANLIGTSYRHLNRVVQRFCAEGLIERNRGALTVIDRHGLKAIAGRNIYEI
ncbi:Crp/Fnr family transcriptional regulator [Paenibacillus gansuensis]|uniref:Crp/Fnr family transcriptional regulator n=1 Tax=Paenibacillus gansuensis TaxID=306542 RepID=A0ABW5PJF5_9BACL